jgi:outer membrane protein assembly factor BamB
VFHKGLAFGFDGDRLVCVDIATGERLWQGKHYGGQLLLLAEMNALLVLSESGEVAFVDATRDGFHEAARFKALTGRTWNHPAGAQGGLFVRNANEAACFDLPGAYCPARAGT